MHSRDSLSTCLHFEELQCCYSLAITTGEGESEVEKRTNKQFLLCCQFRLFFKRKKKFRSTNSEGRRGGKCQRSKQKQKKNHPKETTQRSTKKRLNNTNNNNISSGILQPTTEEDHPTIVLVCFFSKKRDRRKCLCFCCRWIELFFSVVVKRCLVGGSERKFSLRSNNRHRRIMGHARMSLQQSASAGFVAAGGYLAGSMLSYFIVYCLFRSLMKENNLLWQKIRKWGTFLGGFFGMSSGILLFFRTFD